MRFEWDENKNRENIKKHNVSFETAQRAFCDKNRVILKDKKHSKSENRFFCIGNDGHGILTVRYTMRNGAIRIIGAGYWREGKDKYEQKKSRLR
jgi:uncharacterized DUF497 family protein